MHFDKLALQIVQKKHFFMKRTVELQWLEQRWLVYNSYFEHVIESLTKKITIAADIIVFGVFQVISFLYSKWYVVCTH